MVNQWRRPGASRLHIVHADHVFATDYYTGIMGFSGEKSSAQKTNILYVYALVRPACDGFRTLTDGVLFVAMEITVI